MTSLLRSILGPRPLSPPWTDTAPVRRELFGVERLEQHAHSLAAVQSVTAQPPAVLSLHIRLDDNAKVLLAAYRASAAELEQNRSVVPAAEWLLDNYHLVEAQIRAPLSRHRPCTARRCAYQPCRGWRSPWTGRATAC